MNESDRMLLAYLAVHGPASRSQLASATGLSKAAVTNISRTLLKTGIIYEAATFKQPAGHGRPQVLLDLNADYGYLVGVIIDQDPMVMALTNLKGDVLAVQRTPLPDTASEVAASLPAGISGLAAGAGIDGELIISLGVAISGVVDSDHGICVHSANLGWYDEPVAAIFRRTTGLPTFVENDANAVATAEAMFGAGQGYANFAVVTVGRGIGGAQFVQGELYRGHSGRAGELAHCTAVAGGPACRCGKRGCLDAVASGDAIMTRASQLGLQVDSLRQLDELAQAGNSLAAGVLDEAARHLGMAVSHLINFGDPELLLLAVETGPSTPFALAITHVLEENLLPYRRGRFQVRFRSLAAETWARGAARLAAHAVISDRVPVEP